MRHYLTTVFIICLTISGFGQNAPFQWAKKISGTDLELANDVEIDSNGNIILAGTFQGTTDFDPGTGTVNLTAYGYVDGFICKLDSSGKFVWAGKLTGNGEEEVKRIAIDKNQNIYTVGIFYDTADFDPGTGITKLISAGLYDVFICKFNSSGKLLWAKRIGSTGDDLGRDIAVANDGSVYITGAFKNRVDFNPGADSSFITSNGDFDAFLLKLDSSGNFVYAKTIGNNKPDDSWAITLDSKGYIIFGGYFWGTVDFDPNSGTAYMTATGTGTNIFMVKLDKSGNLVWNVRVGGDDSNILFGIKVDSANNVISTGLFRKQTDFDPSTNTYNLTSVTHSTYGPSWDVFVLKLSSSGKFIWANQIGNDEHEMVNDIDLSKSGEVYITGHFIGTVDFDPGSPTVKLTSKGLEDVYLQKTNANGTYGWAKQIGNTTSDYGNTVAIDKKETIVFAGAYSGTIDADPGNGTFNLGSSGGGTSEVFVVNLGPCKPTKTNISVSACNKYTWASTKLSYQNSGTYFDTLISKNNGCDSILVLNLTINKSTVSTENITACNSYTWNATNYTKSGTYRKTIKNSVGCDSTMTLNLTIQNSSTNYIKINECYQFTRGKNTYTSTGTYYDTLINKFGCDSIITLDITINKSSTANLNIQECKAFVFNGKTLTNSGIYYDTSINKNGCDSFITLNLTILPTIQSMVKVKTCGPYTWNGKTYSKNGTYDFTAKSHSGCDSTITLDLQVNSSTFSNINKEACFSYFWNNVFINKSGTYYDTLINSGGCDSIITLNLTIKTIDTDVAVNGSSLSAKESGAQYQWLDCDKNFSRISNANSQSFKVINDGNYAVEITKTGCVDTSICYQVTKGSVQSLHKLELAVIPNPNTGEFTIQLPSLFTNGVIYIYNNLGELLFVQKITETNAILINIKDFKPGVYSIKCNSDAGSTITRFEKFN